MVAAATDNGSSGVAKPTDQQNTADTTTAGQAVSQHALQPGDQHASTAGIDRGPTDKAPTAKIDGDGSITFAANQYRVSTIRQEVASDNTAPPANAKVDDKGRITEVTLPGGKTRGFGYDANGQLNAITEPDGTHYKLENGKWVDDKGKPANIDTPAVTTDGTLVYHNSEHQATTKYSDGRTSVADSLKGSTVESDAQGHVTSVKYADGTTRQFGYDDKGAVNKITETDGRVYTLKDGKWLNDKGENTFNGNAKVNNDGTYTYQTADGQTVSTNTDQKVSRINPDGSVAVMDKQGRVVEVDYTDGKKRQFGYDDKGALNQVTETDGAVYSLKDGAWVDSTGKKTGTTDGQIAGDGSYKYRSGDTIVTIGTDDKTVQHDIKQIDKAAHDLHDAINDSTLWVIDTPDTKKIWNILEPMSSADRQILQDEYKKMYGQTLQHDLDDKLDGGEKAHAQALLHRQDGVTDNTGTIHTAVAKLNDLGQPYSGYVEDDRVRAEKEIRDAINTLSADQIRAAEAKYKADYGRDFKQDVLDNKNITQETKNALQIYFKGNDKRSDEDTLKLADIALKSNRPDLFNEAFRDASQAARDQFKKDGGEKKIDDTFDGSDKTIAHNYLDRGTVSIATLVNGDTHWYHTNKSEIGRAAQNASDQDRKDFERGEQLAQAGQKPANADEERALKFYKDVDKAFHNSGNDREAAQWEAKLRNHESVITNILGSHDDGGWFGWGSGTDKNKLFGAVENISESDWNYLKAHPEEVDKIDHALKTFDDSHHDEVLARLKDKLAANDFTGSQTAGNRPLEERLDQNGDSGPRADALLHMSADERAKYLNNTDGYRDKIDKKLNSDELKLFADTVAHLPDGKLNPTQQILYDAIKNDNPVKSIDDMERAFQADSTLRDRVNHPQTDADKKISQYFNDAIHRAVDKGTGSDYAYTEAGAPIAGNYDRYKALIETGHLPLDLKLELIQDKQQRFNEILAASPEDKKRLLDEHPDDATKKFQDSVLGTGGDRDVLRFGLKQKDGFDQADQFRQFVLGDGVSSAQLKDTLVQMTPEQRQNLANIYFTKYHSLITEDVIGKTGDDAWRFRELLSPTDVGVRQVALDAQADNNSHTSGWDGFLKDFWDYSKVGADSAQDNLTKFVNEHKNEIDKLPPDQQKLFNDAVANYSEAQKNYVTSKAQFAEAFVNATITIAAIGGSVFTGGTSLALLAAVGAGGAIYRTAVVSSIEGSDFDPSVGNVLKQGFEGGTAAILGFLGPEQLGLQGVKVGGAAAENVAAHLLENGATKGLFKEGSEQILKDGLADITRQSAITGDKAIAELVDRVAAEGADKTVVEAAIQRELKTTVIDGLKNKVLSEADMYVRNLVAAQTGVAGKELLATAVGFEDPNTLFDRLASGAVSTAAGATVFHGIFRAGAYGKEFASATIGKDSNGLFAGRGTRVQHADGETEVVGDKNYYFKPGDKVLEVPESTQPGAKPSAGPGSTNSGPGGDFNGKEITFTDGRAQVGRNIDSSVDSLVSRNHATVAWDANQKAFIYSDHSTNGSYVKREGQTQYEFVQGRDVKVGPNDEIRLGSDKGPLLKLTPPAEVPVPNSGNPNVRVSIGDQPIQFDANNQAHIGRDIKGPDGKPLTDESYVSRDHGTLRYDKSSDSYYYTDHSSNGTYINGQKVETGKEVALKSSDDVRLGQADGPQLKLTNLDVKQGGYASLDAAAVYLDGAEIKFSNNETVVGRTASGDITDPRVSKEHGKVRWNEADKSFYYTDTSTNGSYIKNGDHFERLTKGQEVKLNPDDEVRLGSSDGPRLAFYSRVAGDGPNPLLDHQIYVNGKSASLQDGKVEVGRDYQNYGNSDVVTNGISKQHGTVSYDAQTGIYKYTDHSTNGTYIKHKDGTWDTVRNSDVNINGGDEIHLGSKEGPTVKIDTTPGRKMDDGSVLFRKSDGDYIKRPDGTTVFDDRAGIRTIADANGKIVQTNDARGYSSRYEYSADGNLSKVSHSDGSSWTTTDGTTWHIEQPGKPASEWRGKITTESDGSLRFDDGSNPPFVRKLDGSEEVQWPNGRVEYRNVDYGAERQRLESLAYSKFPDRAQADRFLALSREVEARGLPPQEVADYYHQINRLLQGGGESALGPAERLRVSEQIMLEAARPTTIDQGANSTCNVTTLELRAFQRNPADAARLVTDVALTGKYVTPEGVTVDAGRVGALQPDQSSLMSLQRPYNPADPANSDIRADGQRSFAGQIFQTTAVNVHYATHAADTAALGAYGPLRPGDVVQYRKVTGAPGSPERETLVLFRDENGVRTEHELAQAPHLELGELGDIYNQVVPGTDPSGRPVKGNDSGFVLAGPVPHRADLVAHGDVRVAESTTDLEQKLIQAQSTGKLPAVLYVWGGDPVIGGGPGWHVVTVQSIHYEPGPNGRPTAKIEFTNQYGDQANHLGTNAVTSDQLFRATLARDGSGNVIPPTPALAPAPAVPAGN